MRNAENCAFCDEDSLEWRTINANELFISFISKPWFRPGQTLVIPTRHVTTVAELTHEEGGAIMSELGRIGLLLDNGYGTGVMQKYQPTQKENGIKMDHLHFHTFPRFEQEAGLFPVPEPNSFDSFVVPTDKEVIEWVNRLK